MSKVKKVFQAFNKRVARVQAMILLSIIFFAVLTPLALVKRFLSKTAPKTQPTYWQKIETAEPAMEDLSKQY